MPPMGLSVYCCRLLNLIDGFQFFRDDFLGQLRKGERFRERLAVGESPLDHALEGVTLAAVAELLRDQQPSEAADWIRSLAVGVGNGDAKIVRHGFSCAGCV